MKKITSLEAHNPFILWGILSDLNPGLLMPRGVKKKFFKGFQSYVTRTSDTTFSPMKVVF
jgi:hypothetical protein